MALDGLEETLEHRIEATAIRTDTTVGKMHSRLIVLAGGIFLVSLFVGYYINAYITETAERRKLAMFPERNPLPVLRLARNGDVTYANPGAGALLADLGTARTDPQALLPTDYRERLALLVHGDRSVDLWEYGLGDRSIECRVHFLPDLDLFHAYLNDVTERTRAEARLVHQACHDILTSLPNRRSFEETLARETGLATKTGRSLAVLLIGLDRFKTIVDSVGYAIADQVLIGVAARLRALAGANPAQCVYRFEGDLFALLVAGTDEPDRHARRVLDALRPPLRADGREFFVSASIGISVYPEDGTDVEALLRNADTAMHHAKREGADIGRYAPEMNARALAQLILEGELCQAVGRGELELYYQPQVDLRSGRPTGVEALLRWAHPERGLLAPGEFVALAEETGLIVEIGEWVLRAACIQAKRRLDEGLRVRVAVNVSSHQLYRQDFAGLVHAVLQDTPLPPQLLELEITESAAMQDVERTIASLEGLRELGVTIALDDFGTGFSSLAQLKRLPVDKLKIDRSFVCHLTREPRDVELTRAAIVLGHALDLKVLAEGVESPAQLERLRRLDCDEGQGYLFARPIPDAMLRAWIKGGSATVPSSLDPGIAL